MTSEIVPFAFEGVEVRTLMIDDEPRWVAADVARALGYRNAPDALRHVDEEDKGVAKLRTLGGEQDLRIVNEPGLYALVLRSTRPEASRFKRWITHEVIPQIRKTGSFGVVPVLSDDQIVAQALQITNRKLGELEAVNAVLSPKASAWDALVSSSGSWSYRDAAHALCEQKQLVIGEKRLVNLLVEWGLLYRDHKGRPHAYQSALERGLFVEKLRTYVDTLTGETLQSSAPQVRITGKGLDMLHRRLSGQGDELAVTA